MNIRLSKGILYIVLVQSVIGIADSLYLTYEHFAKVVPHCSRIFWFLDCGRVLSSQYSEVYGVPLALLGLGFYASLFLVTIIGLVHKSHLLNPVIMALGFMGMLVSLYLVSLQLFVIRAICLYCMVSAINCFVLFGVLLRHVTQPKQKQLDLAYAQDI